MRLARLIRRLAIGEARVPAFAHAWALRRLLSATAEAFGRQVPDVRGMIPDKVLEVYARFTAGEAEGLLQAAGRYDGVPKLLQKAGRYDEVPELLQVAGRHDEVPKLLQVAGRHDEVQGLHSVSRQVDEAHRLLPGRERMEAVERVLFDRAKRAGEVLAKALSVTGADDIQLTMQLTYRMLGIELSGVGGTETVVISRCYFSKFYSAEICKLMSALDCGFAAGLSGGRSLRFVDRITEDKPCCRAEWVAVDRLDGGQA